MTPEEAARRAAPTITKLSAAFGHDPAFAEAAQRFGDDRWPLYFGARAGVLGPVDADVVAAACGFFAPTFVRTAWNRSIPNQPAQNRAAQNQPAQNRAAQNRAARPLAAQTSEASDHEPEIPAAPRPDHAEVLDEMVRLDVELCADWARRHLPNDQRLADLTSAAVAAAEAAGRPLFAAWRAFPDRYDDPAARTGLNLLRLREQRGGSHLIAVLAEGRTPLDAVLSAGGPAKAVANGWRPPFAAPEPFHDLGRRTDQLAASPWAGLDEPARDDLVGRLEAVFRTFRSPTSG